MANTTVLLREDIDNLGARGEIVKVRAGYARNYLLPRKLAVEATPGNVKQIEAERAALLKKEAHERSSAEGQAALMKDLSLNFERKVGEHGILYGSVTSMDVAEALRERGYEIDRRKITLREAIKETGEYSVAVKLHREVTIEVPVIVTGEGGAAQASGAGATKERATKEEASSSDASSGEASGDEATANDAAQEETAAE